MASEQETHQDGLYGARDSQRAANRVYCARVSLGDVQRYLGFASRAESGEEEHHEQKDLSQSAIANTKRDAQENSGHSERRNRLKELPDGRLAPPEWSVLVGHLGEAADEQTTGTEYDVIGRVDESVRPGREMHHSVQVGRQLNLDCVAGQFDAKFGRHEGPNRYTGQYGQPGCACILLGLGFGRCFGCCVDDWLVRLVVVVSSVASLVCHLDRLHLFGRIQLGFGLFFARQTLANQTVLGGQICQLLLFDERMVLRLAASQKEEERAKEEADPA